MHQGQRERVEVVIAGQQGLDAILREGLRGRGEAQLADIDTTPFMSVGLAGDGFDIEALSVAGPEQLLRPTARWEFDVVPTKSGQRTLRLLVAMRIPVPGHGDNRVSVPALEREIAVKVNARYGTRRFLRENWQWLTATGLGLGGVVTAWLKLFGGG